MCAKNGQMAKPSQAEQSPRIPGYPQHPQFLPFPTLSLSSMLSTLSSRGLQINLQTLLEGFKLPFQGGGWWLFPNENLWAGGSFASSDNQ